MTSAPSTLAPAPTDPEAAPRFGFGANWQRYLSAITDERIAAAIQSLEGTFGPSGLQGKTFLDIGSGSGLFSLAAFRLGANVYSFDFDRDSVACTSELRRREYATIDRWRIEQGSVLDGDYVQSLGEFDAVYSWGVLHHTGNMWQALEHACGRVASGGTLCIAIYNDQGIVSRIWRGVKQFYVRLPRWLRLPYVCVVGSIYYGYRLALKLAAAVASSLLRLCTGKNPFKPWDKLVRGSNPTQRRRGMHIWYDLIDWVGGYPFEVAKPEEIFRFCRDRGFQLTELTTCGGGLGCNEFVFQRGPTGTSRNA